MNKSPDCESCPRTQLLPSNYYIFDIVNQYSSIITNGMGGISAEGLKLAIQLYGMPADSFDLTAIKIIIYYDTAIKQSEETQKNGPENSNNTRSPRQR